MIRILVAFGLPMAMWLLAGLAYSNGHIWAALVQIVLGVVSAIASAVWLFDEGPMS